MTAGGGVAATAMTGGEMCMPLAFGERKVVERRMAAANMAVGANRATACTKSNFINLHL